MTKAALARSLMKQARHVEAEPFLVHAYSVLRDILGADFHMTMRAARELAELHGAGGDAERETEIRALVREPD
ncbi:MAG: hypothetical protein PVI86_00655 [Phycisphaerae bacterium]